MNKEELLRIFDSFNTKRVLIIGDVMVDSYIWGKVDRISPEAPVPVVAVQRKENRLGGAANVALNVKALWLESSKLISNKGKSKESTKEIVASVTLKRFDVYAIEL